METNGYDQILIFYIIKIQNLGVKPNANICVITHITKGPIYLHDLTLFSAWISNHRPDKVSDEIYYPFLNVNGCTVEV